MRRYYVAYNSAEGVEHPELFSQLYGQALDHRVNDITICDLSVPADQSPDGTANWALRVYVMLPGDH